MVESQNNNPEQIHTSASFASNISVDFDCNYIEQAKTIAINIFDEYLCNDAVSKVTLPDEILCDIYQKFGCRVKDSVKSSKKNAKASDYNTSLVNEHILDQNITQSIFYDLYRAVLDELDKGYSVFKQSLNFRVMKEDIRRQEKLYEVLIEGDFVSNV